MQDVGRVPSQLACISANFAHSRHRPQLLLPFVFIAAAADPASAAASPAAAAPHLGNDFGLVHAQAVQQGAAGVQVLHAVGGVEAEEADSSSVTVTACASCLRQAENCTYHHVKLFACHPGTVPPRPDAVQISKPGGR